MKIIHTSDWHLGKSLEGISRLNEQKLFLDDFVYMCLTNEVDLVIIAGDIYDTSNPKAAAEHLFYDALEKLTKNNIIVVVISGNHDSPERLLAVQNILGKLGVIIIGSPNETIKTGYYGQSHVYESGEGYFKININNEKLAMISLPYPSEKTLNQALYGDISNEDDDLKKYNDKIKYLFETYEKHFEDNTINICASHIFTLGSVEGGSERDISLGGSLIVKGDSLPKNAQYIALGHIHKMQIVKGTHGKARYSGSPLQYNKKEINNDKGCYLVNVTSGTDAIVQEIKFKSYKPIEIWRCKSIEEAIEMCKKNKDKESYVYLEIETDKFIGEEDIKLMKSLKNDIVQITPIAYLENEQNFDVIGEITERSFEELFKEFYIKNNNMEPTEELIKIMLDIFKETE